MKLQRKIFVSEFNKRKIALKNQTDNYKADFRYWDKIRQKYFGKFNFYLENLFKIEILTNIFPYSDDCLQVFFINLIW